MDHSHDILIGAHLSISGGLDKAIERAESIGATALQIFTKNNKSYVGSALTQETIDLFKQAVARSSVKNIMVHSSYLINIGASNTEVEKRSLHALIHELERCEQLAIPYLVLHPGSHTGDGISAGIEKIARNLDAVFDHVSGSSMILLETAAGQGSNIGSTFEELAQIIEKVHHKKRVGICVDTCHIFAAGYDIAAPTGYEEYWKNFDAILGLPKLKAIHLNDSKMPCASFKDRHENIGKGHIPLTTFKLIMQDPRLASIPKVLETPSDDGITEYKEEIALLKKYV
jgi:deoxyribonuclease IV